MGGGCGWGFGAVGIQVVGVEGWGGVVGGCGDRREGGLGGAGERDLGEGRWDLGRQGDRVLLPRVGRNPSEFSRHRDGLAETFDDGGGGGTCQLAGLGGAVGFSIRWDGR